MHFQKWQEISLCLPGKSFSITVSKVYDPTIKAKEAEVKQFYDGWQDLPELTPKKKKKNVLFITGGWNAKGGSQEIPGVNRQVWPWSTKWSRAKANRALPREHTGHSKHPRPTTQENTLHMDITRWSIPKSDIIFFAVEDREALYSQQKKDWEQTVAQITNTLLHNLDLNWRD